MIVLEWLIWILAAAWGVLCMLAFLAECFSPEVFPDGPERVFALNLRRLITGSCAFGMIATLCVTALSDVSKFHLIWIVPAINWGTRSIAGLYGLYMNRYT